MVEGQHLTDTPNAAAAITARRTSALGEAIEREYPSLRQGVAVLIYKLGMASRGNVDDLAEEVLHDAVARALAKAEEFDPSRQARPWLMRFATFVLMGRRERHARRLPPLSLDAPALGGTDADADFTLAERLHDPSAFAETRLAELLDLVEPADREVLRLRYVEGLRGPQIAGRLGISEGAARARLSRAIKRLAAAYRAAEGDSNPGRRS